MNNIQLNTLNQYNVKDISFNIDNLIILNFALLVFFTFFGTKLPFRESNFDLYEKETTNVVNQILYLFLFLSSLIIVIKRFYTISLFIKKEKYLSLFILLSLVSAIWSNFTFISLKRSFQLMTMFFVVINALLFIEPSKLLKVLKIIISLYLLITVFSALFINAAIDPSFGTWRGIADQKNGLARMGLYSFLISMLFYGEQIKLSAKITNYAISLVSVIIVFMAGSSTVIILLILILIISLFFSIEKIFEPLRIGRTILIITLLFIFSLMIVFTIFPSQLYEMIAGTFGKDLTFSGRVSFWQYLWLEAEKKIFVGYGYGTYWIMGGSAVNLFATESGGFRVNQAHNGYLEIMLQLGLIGLTLFVTILIILLLKIFKLKSNLSLLVLLSLVILDFTESTLFQPRGITTLIFISFYTVISIYYFNLNEIIGIKNLNIPFENSTDGRIFNQ